MFAFLLFAVFGAAPASTIEVERLDASSLLLRRAATSAKALDHQASLRATAARSCGAARPVLGRYRFVSDAGKQQFEQELLCVATEHRLDVAAAVATGRPPEPSRADQQAVLAASYGYFAAKDSGRYADAHRLLSDRTRVRFPLADWSKAARDFTAEAGAPRSRRVVEITWYNNPEDAPEPGLYVAADFSADFEKAEFVCGYLVWRVQPDGALRLMREEQNMAPRRSSGRPLASIDRDPLRARMGCKD